MARRGRGGNAVAQMLPPQSIAIRVALRKNRSPKRTPTRRLFVPRSTWGSGGVSIKAVCQVNLFANSDSPIFGLGFAGGEVGDGAARFLGLVKHGVDFVDDGGFDIKLAGELPGGLGSGIAFGRGPGGGDGVELFAAADAFAEGAVAAQFRIAGASEIAEAAEARESFGSSADSDAEAANFDDAAGDEGGFGVVTEAEAVTRAGGDGDDVLERAAEFDAERIGVGVNAKPRSMEDLL